MAQGERSGVAAQRRPGLKSAPSRHGSHFQKVQRTAAGRCVLAASIPLANYGAPSPSRRAWIFGHAGAGYGPWALSGARRARHSPGLRPGLSGCVPSGLRPDLFRLVGVLRFRSTLASRFCRPG